MSFAVALFYVLARYRFPLVPLLIPFAAAGLVDLWRCVWPVVRRSRAGRPEPCDTGQSDRCEQNANAPLAGARGSDCETGPVHNRLVTLVVVGVVVAVIVNWRVQDEDRLNAMSWMNVGVALAEHGDVEGATPYFRRAVAGHPESAEANNNLAQALALEGDFLGAIPHYQRALSAASSLPGVDYNLAVALERVGRPVEALTHYERASRLDPSDVDARNAATRLRRRDR